MADDGALLLEYAHSGSEAAFAELVRKHLDLVYSTALRGVGGDEHLARDVSQSVFMDLARKALSLSNRSVLTGWLYTSTCFAAAKAVRSDRRRRAREQEAHSMQDHSTAPNPEPDWEKLRPDLDAVMLELGEPDREALLLRFFERGSLAEVGNKLGLSENAARMRVERALEKLRDQLARRGIRSTAAALAVMLANQPMVAAPAGLAASIVTASVAGAAAGGGLSAFTFIAMSNAKSIIIGAAITAALVTPAVLQYQANTRLREEIETLRSQFGERPRPQTADQRSTGTDELERLRREHTELLRLRGEVASLRQRAAHGQEARNDLKEINDRDKAAKAAKLSGEAERGQALLATSPEIPMLPANSWTNLGFTTPVSAIQTLNWAVRNLDTNAFANAMSWDTQVKARAEALFAALPQTMQEKYGSVDGVIFDWMLGHATPTASYRVLSQTEQGPDDMTLIEQHQYVDGRVRENPVQFHRDENGDWRQVIPPELMPKLEMVINDLAGAPPTGGK